MIRKELKFKHEGNEYVVVIQFTDIKLEQARKNASRGNGAVINSAKLFDMTAFRGDKNEH